MGTTIEIEFENDISDDELKGIEDKIAKVLNGEAVPAPEVEGQRGRIPPRIRRVPVPRHQP